jgi:hypothetical protein
MAEGSIDGDAIDGGIDGTGSDGAGDAGQPSGNGNGLRTVDPASGTKRGRGRPPGSKNKGTAPANDGKQPSGKPAGKQGQAKAPQVVVGGIETILFSLHQMAALFIPEVELDKDEAKELTEALAAVNSFYGTSVDPKIVAWFGVIGVAGKIYGPRVGAFMLRKKMEQAARQRPAMPSNPAPSPAMRAAANAGTPPAQPAPRQTVPLHAVPPAQMAVVADPFFVADIGDE